MISDNLIDFDKPLNLMLSISRQNSIDKPYVVGGLVRDFLFKRASDKSELDLDITTNSNECIRLGIIFSNMSDKIFKMFEDRHLRVFYSDLNIDFSPGILSFSHPGVLSWIRENMPDKEKDIESGEIFDPTGLGMSDVESKILRTPIPPELALKNDPRRIFRAIKFASQFGLSIDSEIIEYVRENSEIMLNPRLTTQYVTTEINEALKHNSEIAISSIFDLGLFKMIPLTGSYSDYLIKNKLLSKYLS
jgi:tRNA nucleotidyltransferase/poly(A) polymerase